MSVADVTSVALGPRAVPAHDLVIARLEPASSSDWPGRLVATVFLQGCPWRCTSCHDVSIIDPHAPGRVRWTEVVELLSQRVGLLDGVVFSGGEPTRQPGLGAAMREVRAMGFAVGLRTGGAYPRRLAEVVDLVDWAGLDIKATPAKYAQITGVASSADPASRSLRLLLDAGVAVQVRTTVDASVLDTADLAEIAASLRAQGVTDHVLQEGAPIGR